MNRPLLIALLLVGCSADATATTALSAEDRTALEAHGVLAVSVADDHFDLLGADGEVGRYELVEGDAVTTLRDQQATMPRDGAEMECLVHGEPATPSSCADALVVGSVVGAADLPSDAEGSDGEVGAQRSELLALACLWGPARCVVGSHWDRGGCQQYEMCSFCDDNVVRCYRFLV